MNFSPRGLVLVAAISVGLVGQIGVANAVPVSHPSVTHATLSATTVAHGGGSDHLTVKVKHASTCKVTASPAISGLPKTKSCSSGHASFTLHVHADPSNAARHFTIKVVAKKGSKHATKTVHLTEKAAPLPTVTGFAGSPGALPAAGGTVHFTASVHNATSCTLSVIPAVSGLPANTACTASSYSHSVTLPADTSVSAATYHFSLVANGGGHSVTAATHPIAVVAGVSGGGGPTPISALGASGAPVPGGASSGTSLDVNLASVSCPSAGFCVAVGDYYGPSPAGASFATSEYALIETLSNGAWSATTGPAPTDLSTTEPSYGFNAVSCASATDCAAVGSYVGVGEDPYVATLSGTSWSWQPAPTTGLDPTNLTLRMGGTLTAVSCAPDGGCAAIGTTNDAGDDSLGLLGVPGSGGWTMSIPTPPSGADPEFNNESVDDYLDDVSCTSTTSCTAVGGYSLGHGTANLRDLAWGETLAAGVWTASGIAPTTAIGHDDVVSCVSTDCASTGDFPGSGPYISTQTSGAWGTYTMAPTPETSDGYLLETGSCPTTTDCVFTGDYDNNNDTASYGLIDEGSGTTYVPTKAPVPSDANANPVAQLKTVSCAAASSCVAVGSYAGSSDPSGGQSVLVDTESTSGSSPSWNAAEAPLVDDEAGDLMDVSCVSGWGCVAVGDYVNAGDTTSGPETLAIPLG